MTENQDTEGKVAADRNAGARLNTASIILTVSIALNLFFVGFLLGVGPRVLGNYHAQDEQVSAGRASDPSLGPLIGSSPAKTLPAFLRVMRDLPEATRVKFRVKMQETRKEIRPIREQMHRTRAQAITVLTTAPLDTAALEEVFQSQRSLMAEAERTAQQALLEFLDSLSEEERSLVSEKLEAAIVSMPARRPDPRNGDVSTGPRDEIRNRLKQKWLNGNDRPAPPPPTAEDPTASGQDTQYSANRRRLRIIGRKQRSRNRGSSFSVQV